MKNSGKVEDVRVTTRIMQAAEMAHEVNKAYCELIGDDSQVSFDDAPEWQVKSAVEGVRSIEAGLIKNPGDSHRSWLKQKEEDGWVYGDVKDVDKKTHFCMVPFEDLAEDQQVKDHLFLSTVKIMLGDSGLFDFTNDNTKSGNISQEVIANKQLRVNLDEQLQNLKACPRSRERSLAITKLQEAVMWLGMDLKRLNEPNPYPNSYNPGNDTIEPTADGLKL